jgi:glutathione peroxidase-family protein
VYAYLRTHSELYDAKTKTAKVIPWNFAKFIMNGKGEVIRFASPNVKPEELRPIIEAEVNK